MLIANTIRARIDSLQVMKRNMLIRLASQDVMANQAGLDVMTCKVMNIEREIKEKSEELNDIFATPVKSNCSPN